MLRTLGISQITRPFFAAALTLSVLTCFAVDGLAQKCAIKPNPGGGATCSPEGALCTPPGTTIAGGGTCVTHHTAGSALEDRPSCLCDVTTKKNGPTEISVAVLVLLLGTWGLVELRRRKAQ